MTLELVRAAYDATLAAETARITLSLTSRIRTEKPHGLTRRAAAAVVAKVLGGSARGVGVLDLARRRYAVDFNGYAVVYEDGVQWGGASGVTRERAVPNKHARPTPLWLIDLLLGAVAADEIEREPDGGAAPSPPGVGYLIDVDLALVADRSPSFVPPALKADERPESFRVEAWVQDGLLTRIVTTAENQRQTLDPAEHGVRLGDDLWVHLRGLAG